jgi:hypothetical protein
MHRFNFRFTFFAFITLFLLIGPNAFGDGIQRGVAYKNFEQWGGSWYDAEKRGTSQDSLMCWAAASSNALAWTGWGKVNGMTNSDQIFKYYQDHWTNRGADMMSGWNWWFNGEDLDAGSPTSAHPDVPGGNFYPSKNFWDYFYEEFETNRIMPALAEYLRAGYGTTLGLTGPSSHAITCWGYNYDPNNPSTFYGVWITDSDDSKVINPPDVLHYYDLAYQNGSYYLQNYYGTNAYYIQVVEVLGRMPVPEPSTIVVLLGGVVFLIKRKVKSNSCN